MDQLEVVQLLTNLFNFQRIRKKNFESFFSRVERAPETGPRFGRAGQRLSYLKL